MAPTHIAFASVAVLGASMLLNRPCSLLGLGLAALGSLLPDIDTAKSVVGRLVFFISSPWEKSLGHRTLAHSLLGIVGFALLVSPLVLWHREAYVLLVAGYISHIALDTTSKRGCDLFFPARVRAVLPGNADWRFEVGGKGEMVLLALLIVAAALLYPTAQLGLEGTLDRLSGDFDRAMRAFVAAEHTREHWIVGKMRDTLTETLHQGRYRVVGRDGARLLLLMDDVLFALGKSESGQLYPLVVHLERGQPYRAAVATVDLSSRTLGALHAAVRPGTEHWLFGTLHLSEPLHLVEPIGRYAPLHASGTTLRLHYARWADLVPHTQVEVGRGSVVVKHHVASDSGDTSADTVALAPVERKIITVTLTLPSLESLQVQVGSVVRRGDALAIDAEVDRKIADLEHQLAVLQAPPEPEPTEATVPTISGDPDALLAQGTIDRKEYLAVTKARAQTHARAQRLDVQRRGFTTKLATLREQRVIRAAISGEVRSIQVVSVKQENVSVELKIATPTEALQPPGVPAQTFVQARAPVVPRPPAAVAGNTRIDSFEAAKKLAPQIYADRQEEFYCGCSYSGKSVDLASCGYQPRRDPERAKRLEWEHVVPAAAFGQSFPEWREGHPECVDSRGRSFRGRNCAKKMAPAFRYMEGDLHNLQPALGEANGLRSNYSYAMIEGEKREFGECDLEIEERKAEPRPAVRGDIARIYFYMDAAYPGHGIISDKNRPLFAAWAREDPVDAWECERDRRIARLQGNANPFVAAACGR